MKSNLNKFLQYLVHIGLNNLKENTDNSGLYNVEELYTQVFVHIAVKMTRKEGS
jgi:hypothetical protein